VVDLETNELAQRKTIDQGLKNLRVPLGAADCCLQSPRNYRRGLSMRQAANTSSTEHARTPSRGGAARRDIVHKDPSLPNASNAGLRDNGGCTPTIRRCRNRRNRAGCCQRMYYSSVAQSSSSANRSWDQNGWPGVATNSSPSIELFIHLPIESKCAAKTGFVFQTLPVSTACVRTAPLAILSIACLQFSSKTGVPAATRMSSPNGGGGGAVR